MQRTRFPSVSGVYKIQSIIDGRFYIGSTYNLQVRRNDHWSAFKRGKSNPYMQNYIKKYGLLSLRFSIIELCPKDKLLEREQYYIDTLNPDFNILPIAGSSLGIKFSEEHKRKISEAHKG